MAAQNKFKGKYMSGTFSGGEGPVLGQSANYQGENPGLLTGGEGGGKNLKGVDGPQTMTPPKAGGDGLFSLRGSSYVGPQNFTPVDNGTTNPFDIVGK